MVDVAEAVTVTLGVSIGELVCVNDGTAVALGTTVDVFVAVDDAEGSGLNVGGACAMAVTVKLAVGVAVSVGTTVSVNVGAKVNNGEADGIIVGNVNVGSGTIPVAGTVDGIGVDVGLDVFVDVEFGVCVGDLVTW